MDSGKEQFTDLAQGYVVQLYGRPNNYTMMASDPVTKDSAIAQYHAIYGADAEKPEIRELPEFYNSNNCQYLADLQQMIENSKEQRLVNNFVEGMLKMPHMEPMYTEDGYVDIKHG